MTRKPNTVGHTTSYRKARNVCRWPYTVTCTVCHTHSPAPVRFRSALVAAAFGDGRRGPFLAFGPRCFVRADGTRGSYYLGGKEPHLRTSGVLDSGVLKVVANML